MVNVIRGHHDASRRAARRPCLMAKIDRAHICQIRPELVSDMLDQADRSIRQALAQGMDVEDVDEIPIDLVELAGNLAIPRHWRARIIQVAAQRRILIARVYPQTNLSAGGFRDRTILRELRGGVEIDMFGDAA